MVQHPAGGGGTAWPPVASEWCNRLRRLQQGRLLLQSGATPCPFRGLAQPRRGYASRRLRRFHRPACFISVPIPRQSGLRLTSCLRSLRLFHKRPAKRGEPRPAAYYAQQRAYCKPPAVARSVAAPGLCKPPKRTGCCTTLKQQAAMLKPSETVAPFGNNRRPC
jgi:hypothetical protein